MWGRSGRRSDPCHPGQILQRNRGVSSRPEPPAAAILVVYLDRAQDLPVSEAAAGGREAAGPRSTPSHPPSGSREYTRGSTEGTGGTSGKTLRRARLPSLRHKTARRVTSELCHPQLKKGNKEPNAVVQLSTQDVTQESKVTADERATVGGLVCGAGGRRRVH